MKGLEVGGEEEGDVWDWVRVSNVLMRPALSFQVMSREKGILDKTPRGCTDSMAEGVTR